MGGKLETLVAAVATLLLALVVWAALLPAPAPANLSEMTLPTEVAGPALAVQGASPNHDLTACAASLGVQLLPGTLRHQDGPLSITLLNRSPYVARSVQAMLVLGDSRRLQGIALVQDIEPCGGERQARFVLPPDVAPGTPLNIELTQVGQSVPNSALLPVPTWTLTLPE